MNKFYEPRLIRGISRESNIITIYYEMLLSSNRTNCRCVTLPQYLSAIVLCKLNFLYNNSNGGTRTKAKYIHSSFGLL